MREEPKTTSLSPDDAELAARAKAGEFDAFETLVGRHERRAYAIAMNILRQTEDAEDAVQTSFLNALEKIQSFRGEASFGSWIGRIVTNTALKTLRKRWGLKTVSLDRGPDDYGEDDLIRPPVYVSEWRPNPAEILERRDLRRLLNEAIGELREPHRLVFVLRDVQGMSVAETAEALDLSQANVKVRLLRARLALRESLAATLDRPGGVVNPVTEPTRASAVLWRYENPTKGDDR